MNAISKMSPWTAKPLTDAAKNAKFRAVMDLSAERVILGRSAIVTGWVIGGVGAACFAASIFGWVTLLPLKTSEVKFYLVDKSTGIIGEPVGLQDAPKLFGASVEQWLCLWCLTRRLLERATDAGVGRPTPKYSWCAALRDREVALHRGARSPRDRQKAEPSHGARSRRSLSSSAATALTTASTRRSRS